MICCLGEDVEKGVWYVREQPHIAGHRPPAVHLCVEYTVITSEIAP
jgi:hypothetical protein